MKIDGRQLAQEYISNLSGTSGKKRVCFISFLDDATSESFMNIKVAVAKRVGIETDILKPGNLDSEEAISYIQNISEDYDGVVVQLPLPKTFDIDQVLNAIPFDKNIDLLGTDAETTFIEKQTQRIFPVARAVQMALSHVGTQLNEKKIVLVGKGRLVGKPVSMLFDQLGIEYSRIESSTDEKEKKHLLSHADIVISGIGIPHSVTKDTVQDGVILIDAGTSEAHGKIVGDIDPECYEKALHYTPVPGGIGPLTVAALFENLYKN